MPISVSVPNWMSMIGFCQGGASGSRRRKIRGDDGGVGGRGMLDGAGTLRAIRRPIRAEADDVARVEVRQFQPILGDVAGRKEIILPVFPSERIEQVLLRNGRLLLQLDRALDGVFFGAFDDGGNDRATGKIAPLKVIVPAAPKGNVEKAVNIR